VAEFDAGDRYRGQQGRRGGGADACGGGPLAHGDQLDGAGHDGLEPLVGLAWPLQPLRAGHEHVGAALADGLLAGGETGVVVHPGRDPDGMGLFGDGGCQRGGRGSGQADVPGAAAGAEQGGHDQHGSHGHDHQRK
jgi:hypothetical protein